MKLTSNPMVFKQSIPILASLKGLLRIATTKRRDLQCQGGHRIKPGKYVKRKGMFGSEMNYCELHARENGWVK